MIKYRTMFNKIDVIEIVRETEKQVVIARTNGSGERRENKQSDFSNWHDTWEIAHEFLVSEAEQEVTALRLRLEQANGKLGQIKGMRKF